MARQKRSAVATEAIAGNEPDIIEARPLCWESFFRCQRYPILRSQMLTSLMAGTPLEVERVPAPMLLDLLLLATACREQHDAEIVDDYDGLITRVAEAWASPNWTCKIFSQVHARWASRITEGKRDFDSPEEGYIPQMAGWYMAHNAPEYFVKELTK